MQTTTTSPQLNIYFTAGFPELGDTHRIIDLLEESGADRIELGIPYSDPVADGPIIQKAHQRALSNGMTLDLLFDTLTENRAKRTIPVVLMGYYNPILLYGTERFVKRCQQAGVSGLIIPDLPPQEFKQSFQELLDKYGLGFSFLITPETPNERILELDRLSSGFLYAVSSSSTTGSKLFAEGVDKYLQNLSTLPIKNPVFVGFGIQDREDFLRVTKHTQGAIVGSAVVKVLLEHPQWEQPLRRLLCELRGTDSTSL